MFVVVALYPSDTSPSGEAFTRQSFRSLEDAVEYATALRGVHVEIHDVNNPV